ncbi:hypothetical protein Fmac_000627 [Flemingia macrophylla]|uniref:AP2/ERF domain-containing protein n=1 Tax=Flemingia macrophylla TaxID=520843 RepID=A0ABD1NES1_9FABA
MELVEKHAMDSDSANNTPSSCVNGNKNKVYKGVRLRKWGKWVSEIRLPNSRERIWLGSYDSPEKAARAFDAALYCLRGRHASFNFPNTPCNMDINVAVPLTPQEIQEVAAKFANQDPLLPKPNPLLDDNTNQEPSGSGGINSSFGLKISKPETSSTNSTNTTSASAAYTPTTSTTMCECDGTVQVDHGDMMDWTFLNVFDYSNEVVPDVSNYDLYSQLDNMHSGELFYSTTLPPPFEGNQGLVDLDHDDDGDPFSHQSFLWNWNF